MCESFLRSLLASHEASSTSESRIISFDYDPEFIDVVYSTTLPDDLANLAYDLSNGDITLELLKELVEHHSPDDATTEQYEKLLQEYNSSSSVEHLANIVLRVYARCHSKPLELDAETVSHYNLSILALVH
jgi:hypothetical protein